MKFAVAYEYAIPYYSISFIGSKFGVHVYFVVCLVLECFGVMGSTLL